jgi:hypothetical protein
MKNSREEQVKIKENVFAIFIFLITSLHQNEHEVSFYDALKMNVTIKHAYCYNSIDFHEITFSIFRLLWRRIFLPKQKLSKFFLFLCCFVCVILNEKYVKEKHSMMSAAGIG